MAAHAADHLAKFTCAVCLNVLADPCSLSCGHSFDRYCIARALEAKQECPTCRAPQESKTPPEVAVLLRDALALLFPEEIAKRGKQLEEERAAETRRRAAEAAARAEEGRRRAAQMHDAAHEGSTMFALFQVMVPTVAGQGGFPDMLRAMREHAENLHAQAHARAPRRDAGAAAAGGRGAPGAPDAAAAEATAAPPAAAADEGRRTRRRGRAADGAEAEPAPRRQRRAAAAPAPEPSASMPGLESDHEPGGEEEDEPGGEPGMPPFMEAMLRAAHGGGPPGGLPLPLAGLLAPLIGRMMRQRHGAPGAGPMGHMPMHFHFEMPDGDDSPPPQPRRRPE